MGDDRSTVDSILDGLEILDEDGPRLIERAFGDEIPSCMDDFADPDDSMWRNGDGRDVLWDLLLDHPLLDPMHGIALDPYVADSEHPDVIIRLFDTSFVDDLSGRGAVARIPVDDGHMDALVAMCERIAHDGRWVASGTDPRETLRRCEEVVRRCQRIEREVNDWEANARKRGQREAMRQGGEKAVMAALSTYLDRALDEYRGKGGWKGLAAEAGIETFIRFATEDSPSTPLPEILAHAADGTRVETPVGTIRAAASSVRCGQTQAIGTYRGLTVVAEMRYLGPSRDGGDYAPYVGLVTGNGAEAHMGKNPRPFPASDAGAHTVLRYMDAIIERDAKGSAALEGRDERAAEALGEAERAALAPFSGQGDLEAKLRELAQMDREREAAEAAARQTPAPGSATPQAMTRAAIACAARSDDGETTCGMGLRIRKPA